MAEPKKKSVLAELRDVRDFNVLTISLTGLFILAFVWFLRQAQDFAVLSR